MPTFKAVVRKDKQRKDGKFLVLIRITQGKQSVYTKTGLYVSKRQLNSKTYEIKDQFVIERTNKTIREFEEMLLSFSTKELLSMPASSIKQVVEGTKVDEIDFLSYGRNIIKADRYKNRILESAMQVICENMGIQSLPINQFTSAFVRQYRSELDKKNIKNSTKNLYLAKLFALFNKIKEEYNTDFVQVIKHNPTAGFKPYPKEEQIRKSVDVDILRSIFSLNNLYSKSQRCVDILKLEFCLCGINLVDLVSMDKSCYNPATNRITYNRSKTKEARADNARSSIKIEPEIYGIFQKYRAKTGNRLFDFGWEYTSKEDMFNINRNMEERLNALCKTYKYPRMTPYWFRHTWATIARNKCNISKDDIDLCLNHVGNNPMADVYIDEDWSRIDAANRKVLDYVFHSNEV